jgi:hypothetical protein
LDNFAGDLEYHPRRAMVYLGLSAAAASFWVFSAAKFTATSLVFALGSITLAGKGVFLLRKSSEAIGLTLAEQAELSARARRKSLPSLPNQAAQIVQDFATGSLFLWPLFNIGTDVDRPWSNAPRLPVFLTGLILFCLGWLIRRLTANPSPHE